MVLGQENPINVLYYILAGTFGNADKMFSMGNMLFLLVFTALAYFIPSWTGMYNIGGDGQLVLGGFCAALVPVYFNTGSGMLNIFAALVASAVAGGIWALWPALLKTRFGISEIVTTLLSNYIIISFTQYMVNYPYRSPQSSLARMEYIPESFRISNIGQSGLSPTLIITLAVIAGVEIFRRYFISGYQFQAAGGNSFFARQGGIKVESVMVKSMMAGGALAGLAGGLLVLSVNYTFFANFSAGYGYTGLLVALIAGKLPLVILVISAIFASLQIGAINMQAFTKIPSEITGVLQSIMVIFIAARKSIDNFINNYLIKGGK